MNNLQLIIVIILALAIPATFVIGLIINSAPVAFFGPVWVAGLFAGVCDWEFKS